MPTLDLETMKRSPRRLTAGERARLDAMTDDDIERAAREDEDAPEMTDEQLDRAVFARRVRRARETTGLTQAAFATRFQINVGRLRDLEQGRTQPDTAMLAYLLVIEHEPAAVERALKKAS